MLCQTQLVLFRPSCPNARFQFHWFSSTYWVYYIFRYFIRFTFCFLPFLCTSLIRVRKMDRSLDEIIAERPVRLSTLSGHFVFIELRWHTLIAEAESRPEQRWPQPRPPLKWRKKGTIPPRPQATQTTAFTNRLPFVQCPGPSSSSSPFAPFFNTVISKNRWSRDYLSFGYTCPEGCENRHRKE